MISDSTQRFSALVDNYVKYRPGYPEAVINFLREELGLRPEHKIADIGSGTGILTKLLLQTGCETFAIEPNRPMREAAERELNPNPRFHSIAGTAENTTLGDASFDFVTAAQAFHWFDADKCRIEFQRVLRSSGWVVLIWNLLRQDGAPLIEAYELILRSFATEPEKVPDRNVRRHEMVTSFFKPELSGFRQFTNEQRLDLQGLLGRIQSTSYMPQLDHPSYLSMVAATERVFQKHHHQGVATLEYDTFLYFGKP